MATKDAGNKPVLIRVPQPLLTRLDAVARKQARSRTSVAVEALRLHVGSGRKAVKS